jgi:hypothetical protein
VSSVALAAGDGGDREGGRGKLTGKTPAEVVKSAREAGLPAELGAAVLAITGKTRLWNRERTDVARELCGHFFDGLEEGEMPAELLRRFGDAKQAARLITRAKKRNRPWWWKAQRDARRAVWVSLALLVVWYGYHAARFYMGSPVVRFSIVSKINGPSLAVPLGERAWPVYRDAYIAIRDAGDAWPKRGVSDEVLSLENDQRLSAGDRAAVASFATRFAPQIAAYRRAASLERSAFVVGDTPPPATQYNPNEWKSQLRGEQETAPDVSAYGFLLPQLAVYSAAGNGLGFDAVRAIDAGDAQGAVQDVRAILGVAAHATEDGTIIAQMVGARLLERACCTVRELVASPTGHLSEPQLVELMHALSSYRVSHTGGDRVNLSLEVVAFDDFLQRSYTDNGHGNGHLTAGAMELGSFTGRAGSRLDKIIGPALSGVVADRRAMKEAHERVMAAVAEQMSLPLYARDRSVVDATARKVRGGVLGRGGAAIVEDLTGAMLMAQKHADLALCRRDATVARLGCEVFRLRHGRYPAGWNDLVPEILPRAPIDPWTGRALGYRPDAGELEPGRPLLYSAGPDKVDDGGEFKRLAGTEIWSGKDWAVWPTLPPPPEQAGGMAAGFGWDWIGAFWGR